MIQLTLKHVDTGSPETFSAPIECCQIASDGLLLSFFAFIGFNADNEPLYIPYVLSDDRSHSKKDTLSTLRTLINTVKVGGQTVQGYTTGANAREALKKGPNAMRASAISGALKGFRFGILYVVGREILLHAILKPAKHQHYYISPEGRDLYGPTYLKVD